MGLLALLTVISLMMLAPLRGSAYMKGYLSLDEKEISRRFPQRVLRTNLLPGASVRLDSTTVRLVEPDKIRFSGADLSGKPWTVTASADHFGSGFYSADLDHNGISDLIYASHTGGNGLAPPMHVLMLLFDSAGRPVPSEMDGYFEIDAHGLKDLVDLDGDGRAEIIRQSFDDGYWITSLYEAREAHWHLVKGRHAAREYPLYARFTYRSNREATAPKPGRHPIEDDLSNALDPSDRTVRIEHLKWADVRQSGSPRLQLSDGRLCEEIGWYSTATVVLDTPERRIAATLGAPEEAKQLLETIVRQGILVRVVGNRRNREGSVGLDRIPCAPEMVWAAENSAGRDSGIP